MAKAYDEINRENGKSFCTASLEGICDFQNQSDPFVEEMVNSVIFKCLLLFWFGLTMCCHLYQQASLSRDRTVTFQQSLLNLKYTFLWFRTIKNILIAFQASSNIQEKKKEKILNIIWGQKYMCDELSHEHYWNSSPDRNEMFDRNLAEGQIKAIWELILNISPQPYLIGITAL